MLDASALLAILKREAGAEVAERYLRGGVVSAVNTAEVVQHLCGTGMPLTEALGAARGLVSSSVPFDDAQAVAAASLFLSTRSHGLSLADRACLALALTRGLPAVTADRAWVGVEVGVAVVVVR